MQSTSGVVQADVILEWLQQEMGYRPLGQYSSSSERPLPTADSLRKICRGNMLPVWKFFLERVKSEKTVEMIRKNILIHGSGGPGVNSEDSEATGADGEQMKDREPVKSSREAYARERELSKLPGKERKRLEPRARGRRPFTEAAKAREAGEKEREKEKSTEGADSSKDRALRERDVAEKEVERLRKATERLQKELKGRIADVSREENERQRVLEDRSRSRYEQVQLEAYDQRCEQAGCIFSEYQRRLHRHVEHAREAQRGKLRPDSPSTRSYQEEEAVYAVSVKGAHPSDDQIFIETSHERNIRKACEVLAVQLINKIRDTFPAYEGGGSQTEIQSEIVKLGLDVDGEGIPEEVKETALTLLKSPPQLLRAMAAYTGRVVAMVNKETEKIDIRADAERLKYKYENDRITEDLSVDTDGNTYVASNKTKSSKNSLGLAVRRKNGQLRERQKAHVQQFMATEESLNHASEAKKISNELIKRLHGGDHGNSTQSSGRDNSQAEGSLRQFELEVWARERDLAGIKASVSMLNSKVQRLKKLCEERKEAEDALRQKWKRIEEFDARRMELEAVYAALMRANMGAAVSWEQHTAAALDHSTHTIVPICNTLQVKTVAARDLLEREVAAFQSSSNNRRFMMPVTPQALLEAVNTGVSASPEAFAAAEKHADTIVARAGAGDPSAIPTICRMMTTWQFSPGYEGSDAGMVAVMESMKFCLRPGCSAASLLENLFKSISRVQTLKELVGSARGLLEVAHLSRPDYERSASACVRTAQEQERVAIRDWLPELKAAVQEAQQCLEDCRHIRGLVDEWWEQPASTAVDWITVDGQTAAAWLAHVKQLQTAFYEKQLR